MSIVKHDFNTEDYNTMREMISEIELKLIGVDPIRQKQFYLPLQQMIFEAWQDACNPKDSFLFGDNPSLQP